MELPERVRVVAQDYLRDPRTQMARERFLVGLLEGLTTQPIAEAALIRGIEDMAVAGADFRPVVVRIWCERAQKLLDGEAGARAAREALRPVSNDSGGSGTPSVPWSEDEVES